MSRQLLLSLFLADHWLQLLVSLLELPAHCADLGESLMQTVYQALQKADAAVGDVCSHKLQRCLQRMGLQGQVGRSIASLRLHAGCPGFQVKQLMSNIIAQAFKPSWQAALNQLSSAASLQQCLSA